MERRAIPRKPVLMSGAIQFAGCAINCLVRDISISGAALDVAEPHDVPEHFNLVFKADGAHIPCRVVWRQEGRFGNGPADCRARCSSAGQSRSAGNGPPLGRDRGAP
jgi:hypothetical protein